MTQILPKLSFFWVVLLLAISFDPAWGKKRGEDHDRYGAYANTKLASLQMELIRVPLIKTDRVIAYVYVQFSIEFNSANVLDKYMEEMPALRSHFLMGIISTMNAYNALKSEEDLLKPIQIDALHGYLIRLMNKYFKSGDAKDIHIHLYSVHKA